MKESIANIAMRPMPVLISRLRATWPRLRDSSRRLGVAASVRSPAEPAKSTPYSRAVRDSVCPHPSGVRPRGSAEGTPEHTTPLSSSHPTERLSAVDAITARGLRPVGGVGLADRPTGDWPIGWAPRRTRPHTLGRTPLRG